MNLLHRIFNYVTKGNILRTSNIGKKNKFKKNIYIGKDCSVKNYNFFSDSVALNKTNLHSFCSLGRNVQIGPGMHPLKEISTSLRLVPNHNLVEKVTTINSDVWIGTNVVIMQGVNVGQGAVIGANSVVTKDVEPYSICVGIPAKEIKKRFSEDKIKQLIEVDFNDSNEKLKENLKKIIKDET